MNNFKKLISIILSVLMIVSIVTAFQSPVMAADTTELYCKCTQSWWTAYGAAIGVRYWGGASETKWPGVKGTPVDGEDGLWKFEVPSDTKELIFVRMGNSGDQDGKDWGAKTDNLTIPTDGSNLYTITSTEAVWSKDSVVAGQWSTYRTQPTTESTEPTTEPTTESTASTTEKTEPTTAPTTAPTTEKTEPTTASTAPTTQPTTATTAPTTQPTTASTAPTTQPTTASTAPTTQPTTASTAPTEVKTVTYTYYFAPLQSDIDAGYTYVVNICSDADVENPWFTYTMEATDLTYNGKTVYKAEITVPETQNIKTMRIQSFEQGEWKHQILLVNNVTTPYATYDGKIIVATKGDAGEVFDFVADKPAPTGEPDIKNLKAQDNTPIKKDGSQTQCISYNKDGKFTDFYTFTIENCKISDVHWTCTNKNLKIKTTRYKNSNNKYKVKFSLKKPTHRKKYKVVCKIKGEKKCTINLVSFTFEKIDNVKARIINGKTFKINWNKTLNSKGYLVTISDSKGEQIVEKEIKNANNTEYTYSNSKLKAGKKYKVSVRLIYRIKNQKAKYYGAAKTVKVKKK